MRDLRRDKLDLWIRTGVCSELWDWDRLYDEVTTLSRKDDMALRTERLLRAMLKRQ